MSICSGVSSYQCKLFLSPGVKKGTNRCINLISGKLSTPGGESGGEGRSGLGGGEGGGGGRQTSTAFIAMIAY